MWLCHTDVFLCCCRVTFVETRGCGRQNTDTNLGGKSNAFLFVVCGKSEGQRRRSDCRRVLSCSAMCRKRESQPVGHIGQTVESWGRTFGKVHQCSHAGPPLGAASEKRSLAGKETIGVFSLWHQLQGSMISNKCEVVSSEVVPEFCDGPFDGSSLSNVWVTTVPRPNSDA